MTMKGDPLLPREQRRALGADVTPPADAEQAGDTPLAEILFPPEWLEGVNWLPGHPEIVQVLTYAKMPGERFFVAGGVVDGGANLIGLTWSSGQHVARCGPPLWALEERVDPDAPAATRVIWRTVVEAMGSRLQANGR